MSRRQWERVSKGSICVPISFLFCLIPSEKYTKNSVFCGTTAIIILDQVIIYCGGSCMYAVIWASLNAKDHYFFYAKLVCVTYIERESNTKLMPHEEHHNQIHTHIFMWSSAPNTWNNRKNRECFWDPKVLRYWYIYMCAIVTEAFLSFGYSLARFPRRTVNLNIIVLSDVVQLSLPLYEIGHSRYIQPSTFLRRFAPLHITICRTTAKLPFPIYHILLMPCFMMYIQTHTDICTTVRIIHVYNCHSILFYGRPVFLEFKFKSKC